MLLLRPPVLVPLLVRVVAMSRTKRRVMNMADGRYWVVFGAAGVIPWAQLKSSGPEPIDGPIGIHSPRPQWEDDEDPSNDCPFLEGCCYVDSGYLAGDRLGQAWKAADRDDEVIWRELESWYAGRPAGDER